MCLCFLNETAGNLMNVSRSCKEVQLVETSQKYYVTIVLKEYRFDSDECL